jgi:hypothetical protein
LLESRMETEGHGVAQVSSVLSDTSGPFGRVQQCVILERLDQELTDTGSDKTSATPPSTCSV